MSLEARADRKLIPAQGPSRRHVLVEITAPEAPRGGERPASNLALVLDRSGSMAGTKIEMAREAVLQAIARLRERDRFSVVVYDDAVDVVMASALATAEARAAAREAVRGIAARNNTDLCGGWLRGCEQVGLHLGEAALGRCLLLTDGLANRGITSADEIARHAAALRARGITTSTFGVGADFDETLLSRMAEAGGGNFSFIESAAQIPDYLTSEVGEVLATTAWEVVLLVEAGEGVVVESLNDFPCRKVDGVWRIEIGSLTSGQRVDPALELAFPAGREGAAESVTLRVVDRDGAMRAEARSLGFSYAAARENDAQPRDITVQRRIAAFRSAAAGRKALAQNKDRNYVGARRTMRDCAERVRSDAAGDAELLALAADLDRKAEEYAEGMTAVARKMGYTTHYHSLKLRSLLMVNAKLSGEAVNVVLLPADFLVSNPVGTAIERLVAADRDLFFGTPLDTMTIKEDGAPEVLGPGDEEALAERAAKAWPAANVRIVFTRRRLEDNWFSHWDPKRRTAIVSLADWVGPKGAKGGAFAVALPAFLAYEIAHHGLRAYGPAWRPEALMHEDTRGCLLDFCGTRADIEIKLNTGDFCKECQQGLEAAGMPMERVLRVAGAIRELAAAPQTAGTIP